MQAEQDRLNSFKKRKPTGLTHGVSKVEGFSKSDADKLKRGLELQKQSHRANIWHYVLSALAMMLVLSVAILLGGFAYLCWSWINNSVLSDQIKLENFLWQIWNIALVSLATLTISNLRK